MATQVINGMKFVIETDSERAEQKIRSVADSAVAAQKKIDQAGMGASGIAGGQSRGGNVPTSQPPPAKPPKPVRQTPQSDAANAEAMKQYVRQLGAIASLNTQRATSLLSVGNTYKQIGANIKTSMLSAGKKVGGILKSDIVSGGMDIANFITDSLVKSSIRFKELSTEMKRGYFDTDKDDIEDARTRGRVEGFKDWKDKGGMAGSAIGSAFGVGGTIIGNIVGQAIGGAIGFFKGGKEAEVEADLKIRKQHATENTDRILDSQNRTLRNEQRFSDFGYQELLSRASGRTDRIEILKDQLRQITKGEGDNSIKNLRKRYHDMSASEKQGVFGKEVYSRLQHQLDRADEIRMSIAKQKVNPITSMVEPDTYADELSRKGLYAGAQIDARGVNDQILDQLKIVANLLRTEFAEQRTEVGNLKQEPTLLSF